MASSGKPGQMKQASNPPGCIGLTATGCAVDHRAVDGQLLASETQRPPTDLDSDDICIKGSAVNPRSEKRHLKLRVLEQKARSPSPCQLARLDLPVSLHSSPPSHDGADLMSIRAKSDLCPSAGILLLCWAPRSGVVRVGRAAPAARRPAPRLRLAPRHGL